MAATGILVILIYFVFLLCIPTGLLCILQYSIFFPKWRAPGQAGSCPSFPGR